MYDTMLCEDRELMQQGALSPQIQGDRWVFMPRRLPDPRCMVESQLNQLPNSDSSHLRVKMCNYRAKQEATFSFTLLRLSSSVAYA